MWSNPSEQELHEASSWFASDSQGGRALTPFRRAARLHQARWREAHGWPVGELRGTPVGNRLGPGAPDGANFLSDSVRAAVRHRLEHPEPLQTLEPGRLNDNLLSSMPLCFNLFGELGPDSGGAASALLGQDVGGPVEVRFEHSPGRRDARFTGDRTAFDVALLVGDREGPRAVVGVETKYHEHPLKESGEVLGQRHVEIAAMSGIFRDGYLDRVRGTRLQQVWRDHLLVLSMLQHPGWTTGRYLLVHPEANVAFAEVAEEYASLLTDRRTFGAMTVEEVLDVPGLMTSETRDTFLRRYLLGSRVD